MIKDSENSVAANIKKEKQHWFGFVCTKFYDGFSTIDINMTVCDIRVVDSI